MCNEIDFGPKRKRRKGEVNINIRHMSKTYPYNVICALV